MWETTFLISNSRHCDSLGFEGVRRVPLKGALAYNGTFPDEYCSALGASTGLIFAMNAD